VMLPVCCMPGMHGTSYTDAGLDIFRSNCLVNPGKINTIAHLLADDVKIWCIRLHMCSNLEV